MNKAPSQTRPGVCPTKVTPRPGIDDCSNRNQSSVCKVDKDCPGIINIIEIKTHLNCKKI